MFDISWGGGVIPSPTKMHMEAAVWVVQGLEK